MDTLVSYNGEICAADDARIGAISGAALYGNGVFTTIAIIGGQPFVWEKHWRRLAENCERLAIDIASLDEAAVHTGLTELISRSGFRDGRARVTIFDEAASSFWSHATEPKTSVLIIAADRRPVSRPFLLGISPHRIDSTSPLAGIKTLNYLDKHLARSEARNRGFHEAVQLNERGEIVSACMANLFWAKNGEMFTPSLEHGCLAGTTREYVLEDLECREVEVGIEALESADDIFLTSAGVGIVQVDEFNGKPMQLGRYGIMNDII